MLFVIFAFIVPSIICALLGFYLCISHKSKPLNNYDIRLDESTILLLQQQEKNCSFSQTPLLLNNGLNLNNNSSFGRSPPLRPLPPSMQRFFGPCSNGIGWQMPAPPSPPKILINNSFKQKPFLCPPPPAYSSKEESPQQLKSALCSFASAF
uniref:Uncharacterized protein n=1 Tax=Meloidogyne enterolobii TaxID=390850 RepID=A0A6V7TU84_MELEN|nr:unnamed protein product [Meloidogyne enterolobii]